MHTTDSMTHASLSAAVVHVILLPPISAPSVTLSKLEANLLAQLSDADPATILDNVALIEGLEETKTTSTEINIQVTNILAGV